MEETTKKWNILRFLVLAILAFGVSVFVATFIIEKVNDAHEQLDVISEEAIALLDTPYDADF